MEIEIELGRVESAYPEYDFKIQRVLSQGKETDYKAVLIKDAVKSIIKGRANVIPNELALKITKESAEESGLKMVDEKFKQTETSIFARFLSDEVRELKDTDNDSLKFGIKMQNSVDGVHNFGIDVYTFRLGCENDATTRVRGMHITKAALAEPINMKASIKGILGNLKTYTEETFNLYKTLPNITLNNEIATLFAFNYAKEFLPPYIFIPSNKEAKKQGVHKEDLVIHPTENKNMWEFFNDITFKLTRDELLTEYQKSSLSDRLHKLSKKVVEMEDVV